MKSIKYGRATPRTGDREESRCASDRKSGEIKKNKENEKDNKKRKKKKIRMRKTIGKIKKEKNRN